MNNAAEEPAFEPDLRPKVFRFSDIDHYRSAVRALDVEFTPLTRTISAEQIVLNLGGCDVNFTKSFPRIVDAQLKPNCTAIGFTMDDGVPIRFNGVERDRSVVVIGSGGAVYSAVERVERQYASIVFTPSVDDRGWPVAQSNFNMFDLVVQTLSSAAQFDHLTDTRAASSAIRESLLAAVDTVFADVIPTKWASHANTTRQFRIFQDIRAVLAASLAKPVYSEELAQHVGVSVRSMHDAILRYRGMSLHRFLRLRRLWLVRRQLLEGTAESVKAIALAFGFWHLGDFSASYRTQFGEAPSETLARARRA
jgi:AraC-like DNA-binding protein